jgi:hypothetical protein
MMKTRNGRCFTNMEDFENRMVTQNGLDQNGIINLEQNGRITEIEWYQKMKMKIGDPPAWSSD